MCLSSSSSVSHPQLKVLMSQSRRRSRDCRASLRRLSPAAHLVSFLAGREKQAAGGGRNTSQFSVLFVYSVLSSSPFEEAFRKCMVLSSVIILLVSVHIFKPSSGALVLTTRALHLLHIMEPRVPRSMIYHIFSSSDVLLLARQEKHISSSNSSPLSALYSVERLAFETGNKWLTFKGEDMHKAAMI